MIYRTAFSLFCLLATTGYLNAQTVSCPSKYNDVQISLMRHLAVIGTAGQLCPNLKRNAEPLFGNLAEAWQGFKLAEMECDQWKSIGAAASGEASLNIATNGLKSFCELAIRMYGPNGTVAKNTLVFDPSSSFH